MPDYEDGLDKQHRLDVEEMMRERDRREAARPAQVRRSNAGTEGVMPAASSELERPQTVAQREAEHMAKYVPPAWATRPEPEGSPLLNDPTSARREGQTSRDSGPRVTHAGFQEWTPEEKAQFALKVLMAKNKADQFAAPKAAWVRQNIPGMDAVGRVMDAHDRARSGESPVDGGELDDPPAERQPVQMEREFTDPEAKARYVENVRKAQENARQGKK